MTQRQIPDDVKALFPSLTNLQILQITAAYRRISTLDALLGDEPTEPRALAERTDLLRRVDDIVNGVATEDPVALPRGPRPVMPTGDADAIRSYLQQQYPLAVDDPRMRLARRVDSLTRQIADDPDDAGSLVERARILHRLGHASEARMDAMQALQVRPADTGAHDLLIRTALDAGDAEDATRWADHAVDADPQQWLSHLQRLQLAAQLDRVRPQDEQSADVLLQMRPDDPDVWQLVCRLDLERRNVLRGVTLGIRLADARPDDPLAAASLFRFALFLGMPLELVWSAAAAARVTVGEDRETALAVLVTAITRPAKRLLRTSILGLFLTVPLLGAQGDDPNYQVVGAVFALVVLAVGGLSIRKLARPKTVLVALRQHRPWRLVGLAMTALTAIAAIASGVAVAVVG